MKYRSLLYSLLCITIPVSAIKPPRLPSRAPFSLPSFGSTHFIVGFPHGTAGEDAKRKAAPLASDANAVAGEARVFFSPDDNIKQELVNLIDTEKQAIRVAIYSFTDKEIAQALINAKKRGVTVELVTDPSNIYAQYSKVSMLEREGIPVFVYDPEHEKENNYALMHHKFVVFDCCTQSRKPFVWTGSYNFTKSASTKNQENVVVLADEKTVQQFTAQFDRLKTRCKNCGEKTRDKLMS